MILKPSPTRKSPAPLRAALRALMVSACALTPPVSLAHPSASRRPATQPSASITHPYLALLVPTPLRFAAPERPPVVLKIEPLPSEEEIEDAAADPSSREVSNVPAGLFGNFSDFNFALPAAPQLNPDPSDPSHTAAPQNNDHPDDPQRPLPRPILLEDESLRQTRPEDLMPFFRLPSIPSQATFEKS